jgi:hypothetical protein
MMMNRSYAPISYDDEQLRRRDLACAIEKCARYSKIKNLKSDLQSVYRKRCKTSSNFALQKSAVCRKHKVYMKPLKKTIAAECREA